MGLYAEGTITTQELLVRLGDDAKRRAVQAMIKNAHEIAQTARDMAPKEFGPLEQSIKVKGDEPVAPRNSRGQFAKRDIVVYIDGDTPAPERNVKGGRMHKGTVGAAREVTVGDYAWYAHELIEPHGPLPLGDESKKKQGTVDVQVGGGFMERALEKHADELMVEILEAVREEL